MVKIPPTQMMRIKPVIGFIMREFKGSSKPEMKEQDKQQG
jgi:hypothetical protein